MPKPADVRRVAVDRPTMGFALSLAALFILVAYGDTYPWRALSATAVLFVVWLVIGAVKRWWKSGSTMFDKIMDEELGRGNQ